MKTKTLFAFALSAAMFVGCSENSLEESMSESPNTGREVSVSVASPSSRMSVETNEEDDNWAIAWELEDGATGWSNTGELIEMTMDGDIDANGFVSFDGTLTDTDATSMRLIYPYDSTLAYESSAVNINIAEQNIDMDDTYNSFGDSSLYMISDAFTTDSGDYTTMSHLFSYINLSVTTTDITTEELKLSKIEIAGLSKSSAKIGFDFDKENPSYNTISADDTITINISNADALVANGTVTIPFTIVPFTAAEGQEITAVLTFDGGDTVTKNYKLGSAFSGVEYARAKSNKFDISFTASEIAVVEKLALTYLATTFDLGGSADVKTTGAPSTFTVNGDSATLSDYTISETLTGTGAGYFTADTSTGAISLNENYTVIPAATYDLTMTLTKEDTDYTAAISITVDLDSSLDSYEIIDITTLTGGESFTGSSWYVINYQWLSSDSSTLSSNEGSVDTSKLITLINSAGNGTIDLYLPYTSYIHKSAFSACTGLKTVTLSSTSGISLGQTAFQSCYNMTTVTNLGNVTTFSGNAFKKCYVLDNVDISGATTIPTKVFYECKGLTTITFNTTAETVTIAANTFEGCTSLETVTLPSNVTALTESLFTGCTSLDTVSAPGVTSIAASVFNNCPLTSLTLSADATFTINASAFSGLTTGSCALVLGATEYANISSTTWSSVEWSSITQAE